MESGRKRNCCFMVYLEGLDQEKNEKEIETVGIQKAFQKFRRKRQKGPVISAGAWKDLKNTQVTQIVKLQY